MNDTMLKLHELTRRFHAEAYELLSTAGRLRPDAQELADNALALDRVRKFLEDTRKEVDALRRKNDNLACALWIQAGSTDPIRTEHVTATPDLKMAVIPPHPRREPEQYAAFMTDLGVPEELWKESDVVRPHWPGLVEHVTKLLENGHPLPGGIDPGKQMPQYSLRLRARKEPGEYSTYDNEVPF